MTARRRLVQSSGEGASSVNGHRPLVKICGVTRTEDAVLAAELGADLVGLNFYPKSPRRVTAERAREIAAAVAGRAGIVGVFVDPEPAEVAKIAARVGLDLVQFHGEEAPSLVERFAPRAIKAIRWRHRDDLERVGEYAGVWGFLFEPRHPTLYGGAGVSWDFRLVAEAARGRRCLVAGGIGPGNAREALARSGASGVDVCSRVETAPGVKDPALLRRLFQEVRDAPA